MQVPEMSRKFKSFCTLALILRNLPKLKKKRRMKVARRKKPASHQKKLQPPLTSQQRNLKRTVPLALALTSISNPQLNLLDTLSKFSHDNDNEVVHNTIFGMGLAGAGTNNARLAQMLRNL